MKKSDKDNISHTEEKDIEAVAFKYGAQGYQAQAESFSSDVISNTNRIREIHAENIESIDEEPQKNTVKKARTSSFILSLITN